MDIHVHVPEGATPKDGPSAGLAMVTSIVSVLTGIPVRKDIAMTGEVTLRGNALPIGGLKEKLLAALRGGIKTVLIPEENAKDLTEIPENVKAGLTIIPVSHVREVLAQALVRAARAGGMGRGGRRGGCSGPGGGGPRRRRRPRTDRLTRQARARSGRRAPFLHVPPAIRPGPAAWPDYRPRWTDSIKDRQAHGPAYAPKTRRPKPRQGRRQPGQSHAARRPAKAAAERPRRSRGRGRGCRPRRQPARSR